jgi:hypothetical protein
LHWQPSKLQSCICTYCPSLILHSIRKRKDKGKGNVLRFLRSVFCSDFNVALAFFMVIREYAILFLSCGMHNLHRDTRPCFCFNFSRFATRPKALCTLACCRSWQPSRRMVNPPAVYALITLLRSSCQCPPVGVRCRSPSDNCILSYVPTYVNPFLKSFSNFFELFFLLAVSSYI